MADDILKLKPELIWKNFHALTQIPRPSKKEEQVKNDDLVKQIAAPTGTKEKETRKIRLLKFMN